MKYEIPNPNSTPNYYEPTYVGGITWGRKITNEHIWYTHPLNISLPIFVPMGRDAWLEGGILKSCCSPMLKRRLKLKTESPDIAWFPFYPQEHKTHNNVSLVMEHLSLLSYIFIALFRDTPLATIGRTWPDGQRAINGQIWPKCNNLTACKFF